MKISWKYKITILILIGLSCTIFLTWVLNYFFLGDYYISKKIYSLESAYREVDRILENYTDIDTDLENAPEPVDEESSKTNSNEKNSGAKNPGDKKPLKDQNTNSFLDADDASALEALSNRTGINIYIFWKGLYNYSTANDYSREMLIKERIREKVFPGSQEFHRQEVLVENADYSVVVLYEARTESTYIELMKDDITTDNFENASVILLRASVESIRESAKIANTFLLYAGILVLLLTTVVMLLCANAVIRPIVQLSTIAKCMAELDFNTRYEGEANDEIGELGQSINHLSEKLEETISDLKSANNQLQTDIMEKIQIDEMRKEFLSNVTHELKTPIALISGYAEGLKECINDDDDSREYYCDVIIDEAAKMNNMVKKLLTLNHIEQGSQMIELERFDLSQVILASISKTSVLLEKNEITVNTDLPEHVDVWADEYMIEEVFTNYLTNAINHCENEKILSVKAVKNKDRVRVSVFNTGSPIPEEDIDKIWIKFYKVDKARTREYGGSGIGLSIVKAIMEAHNKPYGVINHANGVEFWFELDSKV